MPIGSSSKSCSWCFKTVLSSLANSSLLIINFPPLQASPAQSYPDCFLNTSSSKLCVTPSKDFCCFWHTIMLSSSLAALPDLCAFYCLLRFQWLLQNSGPIPSLPSQSPASFAYIPVVSTNQNKCQQRCVCVWGGDFRKYLIFRTSNCIKLVTSYQEE